MEQPINRSVITLVGLGCDKGNKQGERRGEATRYFCIVGLILWLLLLLLILIFIWLAANSPPYEKLTTVFCRLQLWFVINILQNKVQFDPGSLKKLICS